MVGAANRTFNAVCFLAGSADYSRRNGLSGAVSYIRLGKDAMDDGSNSGGCIRRCPEICCAFS